jgi:hypothetical protein
VKWNELKEQGSAHYKVDTDAFGFVLVEPIDLYKSGGLLRDFAIGSIIKYAFRNRKEIRRNANITDLKKIIHYAEMLISIEEERLERLSKKGDEESAKQQTDSQA